MSFRWHPHEPPPPIEGHSRAKLKVLRSYLRAYFDRLAAHLPRDEFKLDLVDGFAGGGTFLDDNGNRGLEGTPSQDDAHELLALTSEEPITVDAVRHTLANTTAARFSEIR